MLASIIPPTLSPAGPWLTHSCSFFRTTRPSIRIWPRPGRKLRRRPRHRLQASRSNCSPICESGQAVILRGSPTALFRQLQILEGIGIIRVSRDGAVKLFQGLIRMPLAKELNAQIVVRFRIVRIQLNRLTISLYSGFDLAHFTQGLGQVVLSQGQMRIKFHSVLKDLESLTLFAFQKKPFSKPAGYPGHLKIQSDRLTVLRHSLRYATGVE